MMYLKSSFILKPNIGAGTCRHCAFKDPNASQCLITHNLAFNCHNPDGYYVRLYQPGKQPNKLSESRNQREGKFIAGRYCKVSVWVREGAPR